MFFNPRQEADFGLDKVPPWISTWTVYVCCCHLIHLCVACFRCIKKTLQQTHGMGTLPCRKGLTTMIMIPKHCMKTSPTTQERSTAIQWITEFDWFHAMQCMNMNVHIHSKTFPGHICIHINLLAFDRLAQSHPIVVECFNLLIKLIKLKLMLQL